MRREESSRDVEKRGKRRKRGMEYVEGHIRVEDFFQCAGCHRVLPVEEAEQYDRGRWWCWRCSPDPFE